MAIQSRDSDLDYGDKHRTERISAVEGTYKFDGRDLVLDDGEAFQVNFGCDALTLSGYAGAHNLVFNTQDAPAGPAGR